MSDDAGLGGVQSSGKTEEQYVSPFANEGHDDVHHDEEGWLISYADLMTLLFGLFAMMFAFADFNDADTINTRREVAKYFGGSYVAPARELANKIQFEWAKSPYQNDLNLKVVEDGLELTFITSALYESGSAELLPEAKRPVEALGKLIVGAKGNYQVRVEGHTDDTPVRSGYYPSNWELSAARAATIVRMFEAEGVNPAALSATGYGDTRPAYPNRTPAGAPLPENRAHNRRVVVKMVMPREMREDPAAKGKEKPGTADPSGSAPVSAAEPAAPGAGKTQTVATLPPTS